MTKLYIDSLSGIRVNNKVWFFKGGRELELSQQWSLALTQAEEDKKLKYNPPQCIFE